jgi:hypothetical protein
MIFAAKRRFGGAGGSVVDYVILFKLVSRIMRLGMA